ncbi:MAG: HU family DNA-binding protein [Bacteroidales bacterium]|nr:HU family DNA-binding protein [Bacteroidales bacterium]
MKHKLTINDLADRMVLATGLSYDKVEAYLDAFFAQTEEVLLAEHLVKIKGLGDFKISGIAPRTSVDVNTGKPIVIKGHARISFSADNAVNEKLNAPFAHLAAVEIYDEAVPHLAEADTAYDALVEELQAETLDTQEAAETVAAIAVEETLTTSENIDELVLSVSEVPELEEASAAENVMVSEDVLESVPHLEQSLEVTPAVDQSEPVVEDMVVGEPTADNLAETPCEAATHITSDDALQLSDTLQPEEEEVLQDEEVTAIVHVPASPNMLTPRRSCTWCYALLVLVLLIGAFVLGQNQAYLSQWWSRLFETPHNTVQPMSQGTDTSKKIEIVASEVTQVPHSSTIVEPTDTLTPIPAVSVPTQSQPKEEATKKNLEPPTATEPDFDQRYPQVPGSSYQIIGTEQELTLNTGKGLMQIARETYGNARLYQHIVVYNNIKDPNNVPLGSTIKLPKLRKRTALTKRNEKR